MSIKLAMTVQSLFILWPVRYVGQQRKGLARLKPALPFYQATKDEPGRIEQTDKGRWNFRAAACST
jgi:hypothetical protein